MKDHIKMKLKETGYDGVDWVQPAQERTNGEIFRIRQLTFGKTCENVPIS
jgi:hypothetical protein